MLLPLFIIDLINNHYFYYILQTHYADDSKVKLPEWSIQTKCISQGRWEGSWESGRNGGKGAWENSEILIYISNAKEKGEWGGEGSGEHPGLGKAYLQFYNNAQELTCFF